MSEALSREQPAAEPALSGVPFEYEIRKSRRRTISIEVRSGRVLVRAPLRAAVRDLHLFVREKHEWIVKKIQHQQTLLAAIPERRYHGDAHLPFLGKMLSLELSLASAASVEREGDRLLVCLSRRSRLPTEEQARRLVWGWYQHQALAILTQRTLALANSLRLTCGPITIRATRSKWGHCTSRGAIQYNWQIILAPEQIVDYLVAHEVCHLRYHNHSPAFWQLVASVCPSYLADRAWLKTQGTSLIL